MPSIATVAPRDLVQAPPEPAGGQLASADHPGDIHLRHQPAAENVAIGVGVLGHSHRLQGEFALGYWRGIDIVHIEH